MALETLTAIIPTIIDYTVRPVARQVGYIIFYKSNLEDLKSKLKNFDSVKQRMKDEVDEVGRKIDQKVHDDVLKWQSDADKITRKAITLLDDEGRAKTKCLYICPNLKSYHRLGRKFTKLVREIDEHEKKKEFPSISYNAAVEDISAIASDEYMAFESRTSMVKDIITELKKPHINKIGVYGLGGVGKTTLAKEVYRKAKEEKLFDDMVIILNVKEKKDNETIQRAITKKLSMDVDESKDMGTRANLLRARIKDGKTLVILDDVLERIDFEAVGLVGVPNCKLLLTSREKKVLFSMGTRKDFQLEFLREKESWSLFEKMAGSVVKDNRILKEATQLAKKCGGWPVLIVAVASALRDSSLEEWKDALRNFKRFDKEELNEKACSALKWSYKQLKDQELQQLFLICGILAGGPISIIFCSDLLNYSMGLGLIKNVETVEQSRVSLNLMIKKLKNSCLLLDSYDDDTVRMHELVRDAAIGIASDDQKAFLKVYEEVKEWPTEDLFKKYTAISLRFCKIPRFPEVPWECPELKLLILENDNIGDSQEIPSKFFEGMKELKVLDVTRFRIQSLPPSLQSLKHLHTLGLYACDLVDITLVGQLTNLRILSVIQSRIKKLPEQIGQLTRLQLLDLSGCSGLVMISPDVISSLTRLEDLRLGIKSFKQWEGEGLVDGRRSNASVSELKHLSHLSALDIHVPDANLLPTNLFSDKLERYTILIGDCWAYPDIHPTSNILKLKLTRRNQFDRGIKLLVKKCEQLYLDGMEIVNIISYLFDSEAVNQLKHFHVQNNNKVKYVINFVSWSYSHNAFSNLESLALEDLVSLESVCYGQLIGEPFPKLKSLRLRNLPKLIGFSSKGKQLTIATEADEIVTVDEVGGPSRLFNNGEATMPNLTTLIVHQCDSLRFLFSSSMAKSLRQLKHLKISKCQALQAVYDTSSTTQLNGFECPNLHSVEIDLCDSLKNVFPSSMAKELKQLSKLNVENCGLMEEIVANDEGPQAMYKEFRFPKVTYMMFNNLPQLRSFYPALHVSNWPSLNVLNFTKCGGVEIFAAEFSTYQDKLELGHSTPMKQPFFLIEKGKSFLDLEYLTLDTNTEIWYEPYGPLLGEWLRKLKSIEFATSHPKSDVFFENLQNIEDLRVLSATWKELIVHNHQGSSRGEIHEVETLPYVKLLWLIDMPELIHLGKENFQPGDPVFPNLEVLCVHKCGRLENLASTLISFQNLTILNIWSCRGLQYLIPYSVAKNLQQLEKLVVEHCQRMVEIVAINGDDPENEITFSCLQHLELSDLPSLQGFCTGNCIFKVPPLETFIVKDCHLIELTISPDGLLQSDPRLEIAKETDDEENDRDQTVSMPNLTTLIVHQCDRLRFLFSSSMAKSLRQLKHLKISKCQALQAIYDTSSTTQLNDFECPNLNSVEIDSCDSLKNVFPSSMAKELKQLSKLKVENCGLMEEIVANEEGPQATYKEFRFPKVTYMIFNNLPQLRRFYPSLHVSNWPSLNVLNFTKCGGVEIFAAEFSTYHDKLELGHSTPMKQPFFLIEKGKSFLDLEHLTLDANTEIWYEPYGPLLGEWLRKLKSIEFATSHPKSDVFFENLQNIDDLRVLSAPWKELIVHDHQGSSRGEIHEVETLPYVKLLWLIDMPELIHLGKENFQPGDPVFPNLEFLCVHKCGKLENLASTLISFQNLTTLNIWSCHGLRYLIPYSVAKNLQQLKKLVVDNCQRMVEIVASNGDDPENEITFSSLQHLELSDLPSLQGFCTGNCIFKVPPLETFIVKDCHLIKLTISPDGLLQSDPRPKRLEIAKETDDILKLK